MQSKTAIVTGANRGIGRAIALRLARDGAQIVRCARDQRALDETVREIEQSGGRAFAVSLDLRLPDSAAHLVTAALTRFGQIDILINNAGATKRGEFTELTDEDWADGAPSKFSGAVRPTPAPGPPLKPPSGSATRGAAAGTC